MSGTNNRAALEAIAKGIYNGADPDKGYDNIWPVTIKDAVDQLEALLRQAEREARVDEMEALKKNRDVDTEAGFCQYCHMMLEDTDQECACLIIAKKRLAALVALQVGENVGGYATPSESIQPSATTSVPEAPASGKEGLTVTCPYCLRSCQWGDPTKHAPNCRDFGFS